MGTAREALRLLGRAIRLRCPVCGSRPIFTRWTSMLPTCPACGFRFERGERGYWVGAYFVNLIIMETAFVAWFAGYLLHAWPNPDWLFFLVTTLALMLAVPLAGFPFSRTLFLALDLWIRPATEADFALPHEPSGTAGS